jgi:hypothetical protein
MVADKLMVNSYNSSGVQWITFHVSTNQSWKWERPVPPTSIVAFHEYTIISGQAGENKILPLWLHVVRSD